MHAPNHHDHAAPEIEPYGGRSRRGGAGDSTAARTSPWSALWPRRRRVVPAALCLPFTALSSPLPSRRTPLGRPEPRPRARRCSSSSSETRGRRRCATPHPDLPFLSSALPSLPHITARLLPLSPVLSVHRNAANRSPEFVPRHGGGSLTPSPPGASPSLASTPTSFPEPPHPSCTVAVASRAPR